MLLSWSRHGLPHGFLYAKPVHVVYRLEGCLPVGPLRRLWKALGEELTRHSVRGTRSTAALERLREQYLLHYDQLLDAQDQTRYLLADARLATIVLDSWRALEELRACIVLACCVMGNHVHVLLQGVEDADPVPIGGVLRRHKKFTTNAIGDLRGARTKIWADGYFDRYVRPGQFERVLQYLLDNPVKAGLVPDWRSWAATYVREGLR